MKIFKIVLFLVAVGGTMTAFGQDVKHVSHFDKVIISPHIQTIFIEGDDESVNIESCSVDRSKLHIEVQDNTLRVYLEGAKEIDKQEKVYEEGNTYKRPIYHGTVVTATITYKTLQSLSLRGEQTHECKSQLAGEALRLKIYGESHVILDDVALNELQMTMYGESTLDIKQGSIKSQRYTVYGEGTINSLAISGNTGKITAYGEADFSMNVSEAIKVTAFGEAKLHYKGDPTIDKGLHFGEVHIDKVMD